MVYLIGAGPGDPGLITYKGLQILKSCDAVNAIVKEGMSASDALRTLMARNSKNEMPQGYENNG